MCPTAILSKHHPVASQSWRMGAASGRNQVSSLRMRVAEDRAPSSSPNQAQPLESVGERKGLLAPAEWERSLREGPRQSTCGLCSHRDIQDFKISSPINCTRTTASRSNDSSVASPECHVPAVLNPFGTLTHHTMSSWI